MSLCHVDKIMDAKRYGEDSKKKIIIDIYTVGVISPLLLAHEHHFNKKFGLNIFSNKRMDATVKYNLAYLTSNGILSYFDYNFNLVWHTYDAPTFITVPEFYDVFKMFF